MDDAPPPGPFRGVSQVELVKSSNQYSYTKRSSYAQITAVLVQSLLVVDTGLMFGIPTLMLGALHGHTEEALYMNDDQASWFGSIPSIFTPIASLAAGYFQEVLGRKGVLILANIPILALWISVYFANSIPVLYACAAVMGLCTGFSEAPLISYTGEIGEPHLRGILSVVSSVAVIIGMFIVYILGYFFDWRTAALISGVCPVLTFALMTQIPESPMWLIRKNRLADAEKSLCWLRGWTNSDQVEDEFQDLISYAQNSSNTSGVSSGESTTENTHTKSDGSLLEQLKLLKSRSIILPFRLVTIAAVFTFTAILVGMRPYYISEVNELGSPVDPKLLLIIGPVLFLVGAALNMVILRRFGKRKIALFSFAVAAVSILGIGIYSSFLQESKESLLAWLPVIFLLVIGFLSGLSILVLPWQLSCEVFPPKGRGLATGLSAAWTHLVMTAMVKSYLYIKHMIGLSGIMYLHAAGTTIGLLYLYLHLPETEGKTLEEIEPYFKEDHDRKEKFRIGKSGKSERP